MYSWRLANPKSAEMMFQFEPKGHQVGEFFFREGSVLCSTQAFN